MLRRWLLYLAAWAGCVIFFVCYREWLSWVCLVAVTMLPLVSLILSLPAMLMGRLTANFPHVVDMGTPVKADVQLKCWLPAPLWRARIAVGRELTGEGFRVLPGENMPTEHCGKLECSIFACRIYDYLGLFSIPKKAPEAFDIMVRPIPVDDGGVAVLHPGRAIRWRAKRGGGYSENYELRLYRPGDSVQQIHWKLSGKTGKLMLREPLEPAQMPSLTLVLQGTPEVLDRKLGALLLRGLQMTEQAVAFRITAQTGDGLMKTTVCSESALYKFMDALLAQRPIAEEGRDDQ